MENHPGESTPRPSNPLVIALFTNAALLLAILLALLFRPPTPSLLPSAFAQFQPPIAGGGGVFVMPAQFHNQSWGCYLLDVDAQTLCTYEYNAGNRQLTLTSARNFRYDRLLKNFATYPPTWEVQQMVQQEQQNQRDRESKPPTTNP